MQQRWKNNTTQEVIGEYDDRIIHVAVAKGTQPLLRQQEHATVKYTPETSQEARPHHETYTQHTQKTNQPRPDGRDAHDVRYGGNSRSQPNQCCRGKKKSEIYNGVRPRTFLVAQKHMVMQEGVKQTVLHGGSHECVRTHIRGCEERYTALRAVSLRTGTPYSTTRCPLDTSLAALESP